MSSLCLCGSSVSECQEMPSVDRLECNEVAHEEYLLYRCLRQIQKTKQMFVEFWLELVESSATVGKCGTSEKTR